MAANGNNNSTDIPPPADPTHLLPTSMDSQVSSLNPLHLDMSSPYYMPSSDQTGSSLVSQKLTGDNYPRWSKAMTMALTARNKFCFVDGSLPCPTTNQVETTYWKRCNALVFGWLLNSVETDIASSIMHSDNSAEVWSDLRQRFSVINSTRKYQLRKDLHEHSQRSDSVATYFTRFKALTDELDSFTATPTCMCGAMKAYIDEANEDKVIHFLLGLDSSYAAVRGQILMMRPFPSLNDAYGLILDEERRRHMTSINGPSATALATQRYRSIPPPRSARSSTTSVAPRPRAPTDGRSTRARQRLCTHCNNYGHTADMCYWRRGFPVGHRYHGMITPSSANAIVPPTQPYNAASAPDGSLLNPAMTSATPPLPDYDFSFEDLDASVNNASNAQVNHTSGPTT